MSDSREKDQSDFDLERFVDMFDEATTSSDPRVVNALRSLMMMVTLTRPESRDSGLHDRNAGPLRRLYEDVNHLNRRLHSLEDEFRQARNQVYSTDAKYPNEKYYTVQAAAEMSQKIDQDVLNQLKQKAGLAITGGITGSAIKGLYDK
jgi:vacuolar-type H+-ATPase subunit I/STV1